MILKREDIDIDATGKEFIDKETALRVVADAIDGLAVYVERKKGKWEEKQTQADREGGYDFGYYCSECGELCASWIREDYSRIMQKTKYCPNCGADMREEKREA